MCSCALLNIFSLAPTNTPKEMEIFIFYKELAHHLNCLIPETGVLAKGHQMGSSSCSREN